MRCFLFFSFLFLLFLLIFSRFEGGPAVRQNSDVYVRTCTSVCMRHIILRETFPLSMSDAPRNAGTTRLDMVLLNCERGLSSCYRQHPASVWAVGPKSISSSRACLSLPPPPPSTPLSPFCSCRLTRTCALSQHNTTAHSPHTHPY